MCSPPSCPMNERVHNQSLLGLLTLVALVSLSVRTSALGDGTLTIYVPNDTIDNLVVTAPAPIDGRPISNRSTRCDVRRKRGAEHRALCRCQSS